MKMNLDLGPAPKLYSAILGREILCAPILYQCKIDISSIETYGPLSKEIVILHDSVILRALLQSTIQAVISIPTCNRRLAIQLESLKKLAKATSREELPGVSINRRSSWTLGVGPKKRIKKIFDMLLQVFELPIGPVQ